MVYYRALLRRAFHVWSAATERALQITRAREAGQDRRADEHYQVPAARSGSRGDSQSLAPVIAQSLRQSHVVSATNKYLAQFERHVFDFKIQLAEHFLDFLNPYHSLDLFLEP